MKDLIRLEFSGLAFVVFAGQSNALGFGMDRSTLPGGKAPTLGSTFIWNSDARHWEVLQPGVNTGTAANPQAWGPEVAFAADFRAAHPEEALYIVKAAKGETGLAQDPNAIDWSPASRGEMFDFASEHISAARASLHGAAVDAVFLFQGEQDAQSLAAAAAYEANLRAWLEAIRDRWMHDPQGEVVFGAICDAPPYAEEVRLAQAAVDRDDPNAHGLDTVGLQMQGDALHYAADSLLKIGEGFHTLYEDWP